jgi:transcriptional regulator with XRE-family HTH domain
LFIIIKIMEKRTIALLPKLTRILSETGGNIRLARLRRRLTAELVCERAGIGRNTLWMIEKGTGNVGMKAYTNVLFVLGFEKDLLKLAGEDQLGQKLIDAGLETKRRGPKRRQ